jgi:hypothetical protein
LARNQANDLHEDDGTVTTAPKGKYSETRQRVHDFYLVYWQHNGHAPMMKEVCQWMRLNISTVHWHVTRLINDGELREDQVYRTANLAKDGVKLCRECERELPVEDFWKAADRADGFYPLCKDCQRVKSALLYQRNKKKRLEVSRQRYQDERKRAFEDRLKERD